MKNKELNLNDIKKLIPHRGPMLLIDKVTSIVPFVSATGIKAIKENESFFQGHFPEKPIMPGVFIIEALAQTASILVMHSLNLTSDNKLVYFMSIEGAKFRKPVVPNDEIFFEVKIVSRVKSFYKFYGEAKKQSEKVCEAVFSAMIERKYIK